MNTQYQSKAIFLDRDGTMIEDVGHISDPTQLLLFPWTIPTLLKLQKEYKLFVVTNQSGVSLGHITIDQVNHVNQTLADELAAGGVEIEEWYVCTHTRAEGCDCIKPKPYFLEKAAEHYDLDLSKSFTIGDHGHDVVFGENAGGFGLYVLTGHGAKHLADLPDSTLVFHNLNDAGEWILSHPNPDRDLHQSVTAGAQAVRDGRLSAFPTETVYGLGADVFNPTAVASIFKVKQRPLDDPLIVHISNRSQVHDLVDNLPEIAEQLMDEFWPGPLTLVLPKSASVSDLVTAGNATVAVRMPSHPIALELITKAGTPIAAPSANLFGQTSPTTAAHVVEQLGRDWGVVIDGGASRVGIESTVLSLIGDNPVILRPGGITREQIEAVIGKVSEDKTGQDSSISPGLLENHYAPRTPLVMTTSLSDFAARADVGFLLPFPVDVDLAGPAEVLSLYKDLTEAAVNLYAALRRLDSLKLSMIVGLWAPDEGLGRGINNRLQKAAVKG